MPTTGSSSPPPLTDDELRRILDRLSGLLNDPSVVVIGGSALTIWHAQLSDEPPRPHSATSDLDLQGSAEAVRRASSLLGGRYQIPGFDNATPETGVVSFQDSQGGERLLDFLAAPYGLKSQEVSERAVPLELHDGDLMYVMSPLDCLRSRVANLGLPGRDGVHAIAQLRTAIDLVPRYGRRLLDDGYPPRHVADINEAVYRLAIDDNRALRLALEHVADVAEAALDDDRLSERHRSIRLPQLRAKLIAERERMARAWKLTTQ